MAAPRTQYARSGDVHLAYQVIGHGPRDIVFVLDWASHLEALWDHGFVAELVTTLAQFGRGAPPAPMPSPRLYNVTQEVSK